MCARCSTLPGAEHILLGLLREEGGLAARALDSFDITVERVRAEVVRIVGIGEEISPAQIPFTPAAKRLLEHALNEAMTLGHDYIGTEHILLGLVREDEGVAARILLAFDADSKKIRNQVIRMLSDPDARRESAGAGGVPEPARPDAPERSARGRYPDADALSDDELDQTIDQLIAEEQQISYRRRIVQGKIDILRAERVGRRRRQDDR